MTTPRVSVCLPNLNTLPFLRDRVESILRQTYTNWELVVSDNYSDDGAWGFFEGLARADARVSIAQAPREGLYANWNQCLRRARGELVYIATSDDTMAPDCLEKLVAALDANPDCDLAHCRLRPIDENGTDVLYMWDWWSRVSSFALSSGPLLYRPHSRRAPFDGLLHLLGSSVYVSITQLLIRRSLFDRIGSFETRWGSVGDFNWSMRAGLVANTVHVPDTWGGWRLHGSQATAGADIGSDEHRRRVDAMIDHAVETCQPLLMPAFSQLVSRWRDEAKELRAYMQQVRHHSGLIDRSAFVAWRALKGSAAARTHLKLRLRGRSLPDWVSSVLEERGFGTMLLPLGSTGGSARARPLPAT